RPTLSGMSDPATLYEPLGGELHRHGDSLVHRHPHRGPHEHQHDHGHDHAHEHGGRGHSHGLVPDSIKRSRAGVRAVLLSLAVLGLGAAAQTVIFISSGSIALLADLVHNFGDALTAVPLGIAFALQSDKAE